MPTTCQQIEKQPRVKDLREKLEALRERIEAGEATIAEAQAQLAEAAVAAHDLEADAEIGEANAKELKAARAARTKAENALDAVREDVNLPAKRRAEERLEDRLHTAREEARERLVSEIEAKGREVARAMLDDLLQLVEKATEQDRCARLLFELGRSKTDLRKAAPLLYAGRKLDPVTLGTETRAFLLAVSRAGVKFELPEDARTWTQFDHEVRKAREEGA